MRLKHSYYPLTLIAALAAVVCLGCSSSGVNKGSLPANQKTVRSQGRADNFTSNIWRGTMRPKIISRQEWKAKEPVGEMEPHAIRRVTIHHTASPQKPGVAIEKKMQSLQNFSQSKAQLASGANKPAWPDVPYHYYIAADGQIAEGRGIRYVGDTNTDYDPNGHALIVLEGNFEKERPSPSQMESLRELVTWLSAEYGVPVSEIKGHSDYASTACPGVNLISALPVLRQEVGKNQRTE